MICKPINRRRPPCESMRQIYGEPWAMTDQSSHCSWGRQASRRVPRLFTRLFVSLSVAACIWTCSGASAQTVELNENTTFRFATIEEGRRALQTEDDFVKRMSAFDRAARTQKEGDVPVQDYLDLIGSRVQNWNDDERSRVSAVVTTIKSTVGWLKAPLPREILGVKTAADDEGGNPYTRGTAIILPDGFVQNPDVPLDHVMLHELFHVLSRHNPALRPRLYAIIGFEVCNELALPDRWDRRRLTNPDAPALNVFIEVLANDRKVVVAPILLASHDFSQSNPRPFPMGYLDFKFMELQKTANLWTVRLSQDEPVFVDLRAMKGFFEKVGNNTHYIIHPEEILADNFAIAALNKSDGVKSPGIVKELKDLLSETP